MRRSAPLHQISAGVGHAETHRRVGEKQAGLLRPGRRTGDGPMDPIGDEEFSSWMDRLGPFERPPLVAVACSGGADSLALTILADAWARSQGGQAIADGRSRPAHIRGRNGPGAGWRRRKSRIMSCAGKALSPEPVFRRRRGGARYALLEDWCRRKGCCIFCSPITATIRPKPC